MAERWQQTYNPQTFDANTLKYVNGKLYSNGFELRPFDIVNRGAIYDDIGNVVGDDTQAVWEAQDIGGLLGLDKTYKIGQAPILPMQVDRRQVVANPNYVSGNSYQFTPEERLAWFASDPTRRSMLYGNYIETDMGPSNGNVQGRIRVNDDTGYDIGTYGGEKFVQSEGRGMRGQYATLNSDYILTALKNIYPNKTDAELDAAAWSAMNDPVRGERVRQAWYYAGNPNDVIRAIGGKLGGLPASAEAALKSTDAELAARGAGYRKSAHAADDAATMAKTLKRIGGVAGVIGLATGGGLLKDALGSLSNVLGSGASGSSSSLSGLLSGLGDTTADIIAGNAAAGAGAGGNAMSGLFSGLGDTTADLIAGATSDGLFSTTDFANLFKDFVVDDKIQVLTNMGVPESIATQVAPNLSGTALQNLIDLSTSGVSGLNTLKSVLGSTASGGIDWAKLASGGLSALGGMLSGSSAQDAQTDYAKSLENIAKMNQFRPVGVTTRFGSSKFTTDPTTGQVTTAGYSLSPDVKAIQDRQMGMLPGLQSQYENVSKLGAGYLKATPEQQAADWMAKQQNILSASRATDLANLRNKMVQEGRSGLGIGGDAGMMAANPELAAYYNSIQQQNRELAGQADQFGKQNALFGLDLQSQAYKPLQTALGGASYLEGLGQQPMDLGINIGAKGQAANQPSMELLAKSAQAQMPANAYNPWGAALQGAGGMLQNYTQQQQQQQALTDMFGNLFSKWGT